MRGVALITGGGRRLGRALALKAAELGFDVAVHHRSSGPEAEAVSESIRQMGCRSVAIQVDLGGADLRPLMRQAAQLGPVTLLVNNASIFADDRLETLTAEGFDQHMTTNLRAPVLLAQAFAAQLPDDREGLIINLIDQRVWRPNPQFFSYSASKAGLWWVTQTLAQALAPRIRVNGIGPGPTLASIHQTNAEFEAEFRNVPLQRPTSPDDIANALAYLVSAPSVTGQMIALDGGQHLAWKTPDIVAS